MQECAMKNQIYGGGDEKRCPYGSRVERCTVSRIYEGTNETNRMLAVEMLVKKG
jgi:glutamate racemase